MSRFFLSCLCGLTMLAVAAPARAQQPPVPPPPAVTDSTVSERHEVVSEKNHHYLGQVEFERGDTKIYAEEAWFYADENRFIATGNVVFSQGANRIAADRADFNTKTNLGTFYNASGIATVKPPRQQVRPGAVAPPPPSNQETDVYFFGDTIEKIGPKKYRITSGGFTTCVQPTPRWDLHADTVVLNVDHYTLLKQAVLTVKGVPMLYVPWLLYPTKKEDRATGFLIPAYGSSSVYGQQVHNAFFWAINRSQDATLGHEWLSKRGQGGTGEYRYNFGGGSNGNIDAHILDLHEGVYVGPDGNPFTQQGQRSYELRGGAIQSLPLGLHARANVSYFSSLATNQTYHMNLYDQTRNNRTYGGNVVGAWGTYSLNATFDQSQYFYDVNNSGVTGGRPRIAVTRNEQPLLGSPVYFSVGTEYAGLVNDRKSATADSTPIDIDRSLTRLDFNPQVRYPFKKWQWFTVNSTFSWRDTYYTRSQNPARIDPNTSLGTVVDQGLSRRFFTAQAQIVGPVFTRIWDTPGNGYAEKFKHSIEPSLNIQRTSSIDNYTRIVQTDGTDAIFGGTTNLAYGLTNRFFAKRREGRVAAAREILDVEVTQTYYTQPAASQVDPGYVSSFSGGAPSNFSPIALSVRAIPSNSLNTTVRAEFDSHSRALRTISANSSYALTGLLQTTLGWSKTLSTTNPSSPVPPPVPAGTTLYHSLNSSTTIHTRDSRYGGVYSFSYDVLNSSMLQQRISGYYNAQCCGVAFEYQTFGFGSFGATSFSPVSSDHRFFLSFTLAGLGNFSPFNGAMGGVPR
jgi:LPS-assembly protein